MKKNKIKENPYSSRIATLNPNKEPFTISIDFNEKNQIIDALNHFYRIDKKKAEECFILIDSRIGKYQFCSNIVFTKFISEYYQWVGISPRNRKYL